MFSAAVGGALLGVAASALLLLNGRVAGISGIVSGVLAPKPGEVAWRVAFMGGLLVAGAIATWWLPSAVMPPASRDAWTLVVAGVLVGLGSRLSNGCTSGHGLCGVSRLSRRSVVATATFVGFGILTVALVRAFGGDA